MSGIEIPRRYGNALNREVKVKPLARRIGQVSLSMTTLINFFFLISKATRASHMGAVFIKLKATVLIQNTASRSCFTSAKHLERQSYLFRPRT